MSSGESFVHRPWWNGREQQQATAKPREVESERQRGSGEWESSGVHLWSSRAHWDMWYKRSAMVGALPVHGGRVGFSASTWRASVGLRWAPIWASSRPNLDLGSKPKL
jgi:hypothetical protein